MFDNWTLTVTKAETSHHNNQINLYRMDSIVAEEDRPFVIKKIWCHGQSVLPPIIGIASLSYAIREPNCSYGVWLGFVVPFLLCAWPFVSWRAVVEATDRSSSTTPSTLLHEPSTTAGAFLRNPSRRLWWGGIVVLVVYLSILVSVIKGCQDNGNNQHLTGLELLLALFSGLAAIETMAFLAVVATCIRNIRRS